MTPKDWATIPLRYVSKLNPSVSLEEFNESDMITFLPMDRIKSGFFIPNMETYSKYTPSYNVFAEGDILLAKVTPCFENGNIAISKNLVGGKGFGTSEIFVIRPTAIDRKFLFYYLQSSSFKQDGEASMTGAGGLKRVSPELLRQHHLPRPSSETQRLIADYLDRETARIDELVSEKQKMLALLEEKRVALVSRVVIRGLDPGAALKTSNQDWLGAIPTHWKEQRAKGLFREVDRRTDTGEETLLSLRMGKGLVRHNDVSKKFLKASDVIGFKKIEPGQMVINRMRAASGLIAVASEPGLVSPDYAVFDVLNNELSIEYFLELFKTSLLQAVFRSSSKGLGTGEQGFLRLYTDAFLSLHFPYPPIEEQQAIVTFIEQERSHIRHMEGLLLRSVFLAKERRVALITAAVTGQIPPEEMLG
ncbi:restriction endonuclease subunit S [Pseudorhodobacter aquimaris]|uniref:restriction endonuclease subunit S n=1 Tax=Pseudorhodobacter aquimaris TaxID=687412 RepID=UPI00067B6F35|nr:restriction endonuclease subunit S [Pseudorhodobacter aquimaris]